MEDIANVQSPLKDKAYAKQEQELHVIDSGRGSEVAEKNGPREPGFKEDSKKQGRYQIDRKQRHGYMEPLIGKVK